MFFAGQVLETVTQDSARMVLTGQAQNGQVPICNATACTKVTFKNYVCSRISLLFDCANGIYVDVRSYSAFASVDVSAPIDASGNFVDSTKYIPGGAGDIVVVRLFYQWPLFVTGLGYNIANLSNNKRLLTATAAFKNEPY